MVCIECRKLLKIDSCECARIDLGTQNSIALRAKPDDTVIASHNRCYLVRRQIVAVVLLLIVGKRAHVAQFEMSERSPPELAQCS